MMKAQAEENEEMFSLLVCRVMTLSKYKQNTYSSHGEFYFIIAEICQSYHCTCYNIRCNFVYTFATSSKVISSRGRKDGVARQNEYA
jgi:hypothetical protein